MKGREGRWMLTKITTMLEKTINGLMDRLGVSRPVHSPTDNQRPSHEREPGQLGYIISETP